MVIDYSRWDNINTDSESEEGDRVQTLEDFYATNHKFGSVAILELSKSALFGCNPDERYFQVQTCSNHWVTFNLYHEEGEELRFEAPIYQPSFKFDCIHLSYAPEFDNVIRKGF